MIRNRSSEPLFSLFIGDNEYTEHFNSIEIVSSMGTLSGAFTATTTKSFPNKGEKSSIPLRERSRFFKDKDEWDIKMGDRYEITISGNTISYGYIDEIDITNDPNGGSIKFSGRDITSDLVDCVYESELLVSSWKNVPVGRIISDICLMFDIKLRVNPDVRSKLNQRIDFVVEPGATCLELIMKLCLERSVIPLSYGDGYLTLTNVVESNFSIFSGDPTSPYFSGNIQDENEVSDVLENGFNILNSSIVLSDRERFSKYSVKSQGFYDESFKGSADYLDISEYVYDKQVRRYRPHQIIVDNIKNGTYAKLRAIFEKNYRMGKSRQIVYTVQGWKRQSGTPWRINTLVHVIDKMFGINESMIINELRFSADANSGATTEINLVPIATYSLNEAVRLSENDYDVQTEFGSLSVKVNKHKEKYTRPKGNVSTGGSPEDYNF